MRRSNGNSLWCIALLALQGMTVEAALAGDPSGGCCLAGGSCIVTDAVDCAQQGGSYAGDDSICELGCDCAADVDCDDANVCTIDACGGAGSCARVGRAYGDVNGDGVLDTLDVGCVLDAFTGSPPCDVQAVDLLPCEQDGTIDVDDILAATDALQGIDGCCGCGAADEGLPCDDGDPCTSDDVCTNGICGGALGPPCISGELTAHRPRRGNGYFPFTRTAVPDADETDVLLGPGIRINNADSDPLGEDDLIEVTVDVSVAGAAVALRRATPDLDAWTTSNRQPGTDLPFVDDKTAALPLGAGPALTVWIEWAGISQGMADLMLEPADSDDILDTLTFHTFGSIVMALGGEDQVPGVPVDPNHGTFVVAISLYEQGYDVHQYDEDNVSASGFGSVYNEVVTAIQDRAVEQVALFGYSHGGGSTHDLAERLDIDRLGIGVFDILLTSYVDGVGNASDIDVTQETDRPPSTALHVNHYQVGSLADFFLDGGPVVDSIPPPTGLNVQTTPWGNGSTHFQVDDFIQVRSFIETELLGQVDR